MTKKTNEEALREKLLGTKVAELPLFSSRVQAGFPAPGDDLVEKMLDINDYVVENRSATFFVRAEGDSMEGAGIYSGDVLVVDRSRTPKNGSIVVAAVYGELVVKRVSMREGFLYLESENDAYEPIMVSESEDCTVWGVVVGSVRKFV